MSTPKKSEPKAEEPKVATPKEGEPKTQVPKAQTPKTQTSKTETPKAKPKKAKSAPLAERPAPTVAATAKPEESGRLLHWQFRTMLSNIPLGEGLVLDKVWVTLYETDALDRKSALDDFYRVCRSVFKCDGEKLLATLRKIFGDRVSLLSYDPETAATGHSLL